MGEHIKRFRIGLCVLIHVGFGLATCAPAEDLGYGQVDVHDPATQIPESVRPLLDTFLRDTQICAGPDGRYYMTGTTAHHAKAETVWHWNRGIEVWKSSNLKHWEPLGLVVDLDKTDSWISEYYLWPEGYKEPGQHLRLADLPCPPEELMTHFKVRRSAWANEIHYVPKLKTFVIVGSMNHNIIGIPKKHWIGHKFWGATFLLKSTSGKAEGPYVDIQPDRPLTPNIDASFFIDNDGSMYLVYQDNKIARIKDDLSALAGDPWEVEEQAYPDDPYSEGAFLFKANGKYHLSQTYWSRCEPVPGIYEKGPAQNVYSYDPVTASADSIKGPYGKRYTPITGGGHGNFFQDHKGGWWACIFWNPRNRIPGNEKYACRPGIVAMKWVDGQLKVDKARTDAFYGSH